MVRRTDKAFRVLNVAYFVVGRAVRACNSVQRAEITSKHNPQVHYAPLRICTTPRRPKTWPGGRKKLATVLREPIQLRNMGCMSQRPATAYIQHETWFACPLCATTHLYCPDTAFFMVRRTDKTLQQWSESRYSFEMYAARSTMRRLAQLQHPAGLFHMVRKAEKACNSVQRAKIA